MKNSSSAIAFDTDTYLKLQSKEIQRVVGKSSGRLYIEFGGKLIQDRHSARVLPGYREDSKFELIKNMCIEAEII
ncbi:DUF1846 family protein, partial [Patescibacteria group bacterium]|nr:DUF1846 family protein [Patescibacteria group bacterium]